MMDQPFRLYSNERFKRASLISLGLGVVIFICCLSCYSPTASIYSARSSLFDLTVTGMLLGTAVFLVGSAIASFSLFRSLPPELRRAYYTHAYYRHPDPLRDEPLLTKQGPHYHAEEMRRSHEDWYNNPGNPASPFYMPSRSDT
jgi:hypothetical protein